ncbi:BSD domain-containing protein 1-like [Senna tora]|uniref:BSD domain-containing protein 1-like n=1 Tax=Senna tora TaxID=362788 RepID=A0A834T1T1_9FABA|nr:BSD domain-containing protein 1-like [Senna tora]
MDFFNAVLSDDLQRSSDLHVSGERRQDDQASIRIPNPDTTWSFGGLIKTLASKSESVIESYRRDLEEFSSGLKKETAVIREVASRAVMDLPASLDVGASVAQESLESVGQAIDDIGSSVWKSTAQIISHGFKRYSRFDALVRALQSDVNTYLEEPEDLGNYHEWKLGFELDKKGEEIENLIEENGMIGEIYGKVVPSRIDGEIFWSRYFYRLHKLKQAEDTRAKLVKRAISGEEEEDLSWDFDDEDDGYEPKGNSSEVKELKEAAVTTVDHSVTAENVKGSASKSDSELDVEFDEQAASQAKAENGESCKDSDISVVSSQPSMPEEEEIGWDEIEDIGSNDESKGDGVGMKTRIHLRERFSAADQEEDLSWDIEDDDEGVNS